MIRVRFSIAQLMGGITFIGVSLASLKTPSILWNSLLFSLTGGTLAVAILLAAYHQGKRRAFWLAFSVLGWCHFFLAFWGNEEVPFLLNDYALKYIQERVIGLRESTGGGGMLDLDTIRRQSALSIVTLLIASVGGHATARIFARDGLT